MRTVWRVDGVMALSSLASGGVYGHARGVVGLKGARVEACVPWCRVEEVACDVGNILFTGPGRALLFEVALESNLGGMVTFDHSQTAALARQLDVLRNNTPLDLSVPVATPVPAGIDYLRHMAKRRRS